MLHQMEDQTKDVEDWTSALDNNKAAGTKHIDLSKVLFSSRISFFFQRLLWFQYIIDVAFQNTSKKLTQTTV